MSPPARYQRRDGEDDLLRELRDARVRQEDRMTTAERLLDVHEERLDTVEERLCTKVSVEVFDPVRKVVWAMTGTLLAAIVAAIARLVVRQ